MFLIGVTVLALSISPVQSLLQRQGLMREKPRQKELVFIDGRLALLQRKRHPAKLFASPTGFTRRSTFRFKLGAVVTK